MLSLMVAMSVAWAAKKPPVEKAPEGPPLPPAAVLEAPAPRGLAAPMDGSSETLDITAMRRTEITYDFDLVDPELLPDAAASAGLLATLAADPRWRLSGSPGALVATLRAQTSLGWTAPVGAFHDAGGVLWAAAVWPGAGPGWSGPLVQAHDAKTTHVSMAPATINVAPWVGRKATAVVVRGIGASYGVYEAGGNDRPRTEAALSALGDALWAVENAGDLAARDGGAGAMLPRGEPGALAKVVVAGTDVRGRVNPGEPGWVWLRVMAGGAPVDEVAVAAATRERVGWSADPAHGFLMQSTVESLPAGAVEVWFDADGGGWQPRKLL
jgi:hypothetical protein